MKSERGMRTARLSLGANLTFGLYTGALGILSLSWWYCALATYYIVLAVMRFAVLMWARRAEAETGRFISHFTGGMLLMLAVTLAGTTYLSFESERGIKYHEIVMITLALYTFTKITLAIILLARSGALHRQAVKILRSISLADAAASVFALQRSMLVSFAGMSAGNIRLMNALTGTAVYLLVAALGLHLTGGKGIIMAESKLKKANDKLAEAVTDGYKKIEKGVVGGYKKIEHGVVGGYTKMEDRFIDRFLAKDGETVEEARERLRRKED